MSKLIDLSKMVSPWWRFRLTNNIQRTLEKVKCPVLAMHGQKDLQILPDENLKGIETSLRKGGNADYIIKKFPGLNHRFQTCNTGFPSECYQISQTISPEVLQYLGNWIEKHVK